MHWKFHLPKIVKVVSNASFTALLLYWTFLAFSKFHNQPIASYISYTKGDDNVKIEFPHLTFCSMYEHRFFHTIITNLRTNASYDVDNFLSSHSPNLSEFFISGTFRIGYDKVAHLSKDYFTPLIQNQWGPCLEFDLGNRDISVKGNSNSASISLLRLELNFSAFRHDYLLVALHSQYDLADAMDTNPFICIPTKDAKLYELNLKKRIIHAESTREFPCQDTDVRTCLDVEGNIRIAQTFGCKVPFIYNGKNLRKYVPGYEDLPSCKRDILLDALELFWGNSSEACMRSRACQGTKYDFKYHTFDLDDKHPKDHSVFLATFSTFEVEHYYTYVSYDIQSLIAELGGLLGMTLGLSFASAGDVLANIINRKIHG